MFSHNQKKKKSHPQHRCIGETCKPEKKISRHISCNENCFHWTPAKSVGSPITERGCTIRLQVHFYLNNSPLWIFFFEYSSNFDIFFKEHLRKTAEATCAYFSVTTLHFKPKRRILHLVKYVFFFSKKFLIRCLTGYRSPLESFLRF